MIVKQNYKNWNVMYAEGELRVTCIIDGESYIRVYSINNEYVTYKEFDVIEFDGEYCFFMHFEDEFMIQVKLQEESELIIDKFDVHGVDHLDSIGCHDFAEEIIVE